ncbi:MAG: PQQ-dependent sugar dehydrogenase, partial [Myxococcales bacterium]|nr:PQQ-dependent sugar dehydrogenase [Myxococcales bacterium]
NGGDLRFGPDGYLYIALGDGGSGGDPQNHAQRPETILGSLLRIDVDQGDPVCRTPYGIPADNPFAEGRCGMDQPTRGRPEVYAWGLRNVWRMAFDPGTGELWAADVGQDEIEEIDLIVRGGNYGWRAIEGDRCYEAGCDPAGFIAPIHTYGHDEGESITGGFVYRGARLPELFGAYLFADYASGRIWALRRGDAGAPADVTLLADTDHRISSFGEDADGELYVVAFTAGQSILRLRRRGGVPDPEPIPPTLSATGCYADTATATLAPGVIPFRPAAPFWSDGAEKRRFFALPAGAAMTWRPDDAFEFPEGSVTVKEFRLPDAAGQPRLFETRLFVKDADRWSGYSYRWRADGTDADLVAGALQEDLATPAGPQPWLYPSRSQCDACHTREAGYALGLSSRQLNSPLDYGAGPQNQLAALAEAGYLAGLPGPPAELPAFVAPTDPDAPIEARARAWLHTNCAGCHRPDSRVDADLDLRADIPLAEMKICDVEPRHPDPADPEAPLLAPGDAAGSVLFQRLRVRGERQMPPLGTFAVDLRGRDLVGAWIQQLEGCP